MKNLKGFLALVLLLVIGACGKEAPERKTPGAGRTVKAQTLTLKEERVALYRELPGTVEARERARLSSKVGGFVREVRVAEGDRVRKGEVLLRLDDQEIRERIRALSEAHRALSHELSAVSARLRFAEAEYRRFAKLYKEEAATAEEFEAKKSEYEALSAQKEALAARMKEIEARLNQVRSLLPYTVLRAPFSGRVVRKWVDEGTFVRPGEPLLEVESRKAGKRLVFQVEEEFFERVAPGLEIWATFPAAGRSLKLKVTEVVPAVSPESRTFTVKADLPPDFPLPSGSYAQVFFPIGERKGLFVPRAALVDRGGFRALFVVEKDGRVSLRVVRLGKTFFRHEGKLLPACPGVECEAVVEVLSGVSAGERVVVHPPLGLREGDRIEGA
ncbi:efflux RND transporter periplasmic adaptor subunit [Thermosulfurimonas marina]|uniref:Efflux RND transporter periplasmic adaptor subunit n=1 Tax=Thermosulfurimonas marina TaxID=2047767 RepID=A0A6H1WT96_9BACT|nr:efflux RND transporter periplasmic adaptor subunit [Thermosulfurimonas marina]QJA06445.1 efflux RND transporter periplasmic adaptor subunit [Thermosulfurimonas marina]